MTNTRYFEASFLVVDDRALYEIYFGLNSIADGPESPVKAEGREKDEPQWTRGIGSGTIDVKLLYLVAARQQQPQLSDAAVDCIAW